MDINDRRSSQFTVVAGVKNDGIKTTEQSKWCSNQLSSVTNITDEAAGQTTEL